MHIVHILFTLSTGGMESMLMDIISEQSNYERVSLIIINRENNYKILDFLNKDIPVYIVNRPKGSNNPYWVFKLNSILFRLKANIVHIHNGNTIKLLFKNPRTRYVYTEHDTKLGIKNPKKFDQIYAISKSVKNKLYETFRYNASLVYNGIKTESIFSNAQERKSKIFNLVQISRLETQKKGQHILIQAINELVNNRGINNIHVDFIGDGESLNELIQLCEKYNLSKYISFKGAVNRTDIYKNLHNYQLLVQPSLYEGFGLTVAEAMAAGVPVLVSDIEGPMEIIENGKYGNSFKTGNPLDCASMIEKIMIDYPDYLTLAEIAEKHVKKTFDIKATATCYLDNYHFLLDKKNKQ